MLFPWEKLPGWITGPLIALLGLELALGPSEDHSAKALLAAIAFILVGIGITFVSLRRLSCRTTWHAIVRQLHGHDPLLQWSTKHSIRFVGRLNEGDLTDSGPKDGVLFRDLDAVVVLADCTLLGRRFHCDLASLAADLRKLRGVDVLPATRDGTLSMLPNVPALRIRVRLWPRWIEHF